MANKIKCIALSALVLPGLGQLYRGSRVKGGVMLLLDNIFLLGGLFVGLRSAGKLMVAGREGLAPEQVLAAIQADSPYVQWLLGAFMIVWAYGVVDAVFYKGEETGRD